MSGVRPDLIRYCLLATIVNDYGLTTHPLDPYKFKEGRHGGSTKNRKAFINRVRKRRAKKGYS